MARCSEGSAQPSQGFPQQERGSAPAHRQPRGFPWRGAHRWPFESICLELSREHPSQEAPHRGGLGIPVASGAVAILGKFKSRLELYHERADPKCQRHTAPGRQGQQEAALHCMQHPKQEIPMLPSPMQLPAATNSHTSAPALKMEHNPCAHITTNSSPL